LEWKHTHETDHVEILGADVYGLFSILRQASISHLAFIYTCQLMIITATVTWYHD